MSRFKVLAGSRRKTLGALATLLVAVGVAVGSGANFTSTTANPSNTFSAGNLTQTNDKDGSAILTASLMKPGDVATGTVVIGNSGDIAGNFSLDDSSMSDTAGPNGGKLSDVLTLKVEDITGVPSTVYDGAIKSMPSQALGSFAAGASRTYKFTVTFPDGGTPASNATGDNSYKSSSMSIQYDWTAAT